MFTGHALGMPETETDLNLKYLLFQLHGVLCKTIELKNTHYPSMLLRDRMHCPNLRIYFELPFHVDL